MAEAEVPEVKSYDVPSRLLGKDGRPAPHVTADKYSSDYPESINNTDEFFGKVSNNFEKAASHAVVNEIHWLSAFPLN